ncbi:hypothetical protein N7472_010695 [Penicillium cf. griseofulvum]|uniref:Uncharacterized protein n=1 Tax=Penicillium cf. griseofulvum TaxID=2972120 RepID=A0A9W9IW68_9EURO|nr:hypothetical protein N7472_010695 [Penicillium cf. griseofulvum]KAJ5436948.1 hypothetical protein N7445_007833 [Penicillium cf. griseofulvum]
MYTLFLGYCPTDNDDESANDRTKRDMVDVTPTQWPATLAIEKRGAAARYVAIAGKVTVEILAAAYPSIGDLFGVKNFNQILRVGFTLAERYCTVPGLSKFTIPSGKTPSGLSGMHSEHVIDRQVIVSFIKAAVSDVLASGKLSKLTPIPISFWQAVWLAGNAALGARPAVGSSNGISPNTPNARVMEAFGSRYYPSPILATDTNINGPKGRLMGLKAAASINRIRTLAEMAVKNDDTKSAANLLTAIRDGFSVFEYLNDPHVTRKWNTVLQQVALQWSYAEKDAGQAGLQEWWWEWAQDYLQLVEDNGQGWAAEAIQAAAGIYTNARVVGKTLATHEEVISALSSFQSKISNLHMPAIPVTKTPSS